MSSESTKRLLVEGLTPVRTLGSPFVRAFLMTVVLVAQCIAAVILLGEGSEVSIKLTSEMFYVQVISMVILGFVANIIAIKSSIPGEVNRITVFVLLIGCAAIVYGSVFATSPIHEQSLTVSRESESTCPLGILVYVVLFSPWIFSAMRRGLCLNVLTSIFASAVVCGTFAILTLHFLCPRISAVHFLWYHLVPAIGISLLAPILFWAFHSLRKR